VSRQPSAISRQPSAVSHQPSAISLQLLLLLMAAPLAAQDHAARALDFERRADHAAAAAAWKDVLTQKPTDLAAILGLERALTAMGRLAEMTDRVRAIVARDANPGTLGVAIRVWTAVRQPDSARAAVERWAALEPGSEMPFQEWGLAAYAARDRVAAREAYLLGRRRLGRADAMAAELGQLAALEGDWPGAAREWITAIRRVPGYRGAAISTLGQVPPASRPALLQELGRSGDLMGERVAASLTIRWGDPVSAVRRLVAALPRSGSEAVDALQDVLEELRTQQTSESRLARAAALDALADRSTGAERTRYRLDGARAYADGGDQTSARRLLSMLAADSAATPNLAASATSTLVGVLVDEGKVQEADRRYRELAPHLGSEDRERLALHIAQAWMRQGRLGRADTLLAADSSVDAMAIRGRVALFRGDLAAARTMLTEAGPFTGERAAATERIGLLGLLQVIEEDSFPALGQAFLLLERHDSTRAAEAFELLAPGLPPDHGGAELLLLAGRIRSGLGEAEPAERILRQVVAQAVPASSAAAEFALAELLVRTGKRDQAVTALEHLLVTWPTSAVVPQARRLLDVARGAVPSV
jgi:tetratricopeptide (TPR) repeat protein